MSKLIKLETITEIERNSLLMDIKKFVADLSLKDLNAPESDAEKKLIRPFGDSFGYCRDFKHEEAFEGDDGDDLLWEIENYVVTRLPSSLSGKVQITANPSDEKYWFTVEIELLAFWRE